MNLSRVHIRELAGWSVDDYKYRPNEALTQEKLSQATDLVAQRPHYEQSNAILAEEKEQLRQAFSSYKTRPDLLVEMSGLSWDLGVVDLRSLLAFQRRLFFHPQRSQPSIPIARDWPALLSLCFGPPAPIEYESTHDHTRRTLTLRSSNPNLHLRSTGNISSPISVHAGSPFFEVASFRDRWFLRDGYHRAYSLLRASVFEVPAVIVRAATIEELGATQPWFFSEAELFSSTPPQLLDFLKDELVLEYDRPQLIKTLHITMEETLTPQGEQS